MDLTKIQSIANQLKIAENSRVPIGPISNEFPELTVEEAYAVQRTNAKLRTGEKLRGFKVGLTSLVAQKYFGVYEPDFGHLFDSMELSSGSALDIEKCISPKIEGEIAFELSEPLFGPQITLERVLESIHCYYPALEIIDSRIKDWKIRATDTIADNGSSYAFVLGDPIAFSSHVDFSHLGLVLEKNLEVVSTGCGAAVLGNPIHSILFLVKKLSEIGLGIERGQIILTGALTEVFTLERGDTFRVSLGPVGCAELKIK